MTGHRYWYAINATASLCILALFVGCAETDKSVDPLAPTYSVSAVKKDVAPPGAIESRTKIYLTAKDSVDSQQIKNFVEYLGCRLIKNLPNNGNIYVVEVPPTVNAKNALTKFNAHPWIIAATINEERAQ